MELKELEHSTRQVKRAAKEHERTKTKPSDLWMYYGGEMAGVSRKTFLKREARKKHLALQRKLLYPGST